MMFISGDRRVSVDADLEVHTDRNIAVNFTDEHGNVLTTRITLAEAYSLEARLGHYLINLERERA